MPWRAHHEQIWKQLAEQVGGQFHDEQGWSGDRVTATVGHWSVVLDLHTLPGWRMQQTLLRLRAPFLRTDRFRFDIHRNGVLAELADLTGLSRITSEIAIGEQDFDRHFTVHANDPDEVRQFLADARLRELMEAAGEFRLEIRRNDGALGVPLPPDVDELRLETTEMVSDTNKLRLYFDLLGAALERLVDIGAATPAKPDVKL